MTRKTTVKCDRCGSEFGDNSPSEGVTFVEVTFGGNGAMRDKIDGIDLCRGCYGGMVSAIRAAAAKVKA